jgi:hypothetical protein
MTWTRPRIIQSLRRLHRAGADLSYNALARLRPALVSAAAYHFASYRSALDYAGIDYAQHRRRPRWTKRRIIALIKQARRAGDELHWSAVTRRGDELTRAAYASLQRRLFGRWPRALHAAGLDADEVTRYHAWDRNRVLFELRARRRDGDALNSAGLQEDDPALHAAAVRYFGTYERALRAAHVDPARVRMRRRWSREQVIRELKKAHRRGWRISASHIRRKDPALHGASLRIFGSFVAARRAAGIPFRHVGSGPRRAARRG